MSEPGVHVHRGTPAAASGVASERSGAVPLTALSGVGGRGEPER